MLLLPGKCDFVKDTHFVGPLVHKWEEYSKIVWFCSCVYICYQSNIKQQFLNFNTYEIG